ncbi:MAG: hypothetical protein JSU03_04340 [Bacteroidetes bacterium]|nr:hypothetical protein [Bacteroidota bacterium]MBS1756484.1 hypothetical protein [Bacteroidota bacterium]
MKKLIALIAFILARYIGLACPLCEKQQPKLLQGISHGTGPQSQWDMVIVWSMVAIVLVTLFYSVKWLVKPGEKSNTHIKHFILNFE